MVFSCHMLLLERTSSVCQVEWSACVTLLIQSQRAKVMSSNLKSLAIEIIAPIINPIGIQLG